MDSICLAANLSVCLDPTLVNKFGLLCNGNTLLSSSVYVHVTCTQLHVRSYMFSIENGMCNIHNSFTRDVQKYFVTLWSIRENRLQCIFIMLQDIEHFEIDMHH